MKILLLLTGMNALCVTGITAMEKLPSSKLKRQLDQLAQELNEAEPSVQHATNGYPPLPKSARASGQRQRNLALAAAARKSPKRYMSFGSLGVDANGDGIPPVQLFPAQRAHFQEKDPRIPVIYQRHDQR